MQIVNHKLEGTPFAATENMGEDPELYETTAQLNIRKGPGVSFDPVLGSPLVEGTRLRVADQEGLWWPVLTERGSVEGWVHSRFLTEARLPVAGGSA